MTDLQALVACAEISENDVLYYNSANQEFQPVHAVVLDHKEKGIVLTIRGTSSIFDGISDAYAHYDEVTCAGITGKVHSGIMRSARIIEQLVRPVILKAIQDYEGYRVICTGHSLGAGTAALITLLWLEHEEIKQAGLHAYTLAPPPVVSDEFISILEDYSTLAINGIDIVPRASLGAFRDFFNALLEIKKLDKANNYIQPITIINDRNNFTKQQEADIGRYYEYLRQQSHISEKLYPPGIIFQIFRQDLHHEFKFFTDREVKQHGGWTSHQDYLEIIFGKSMVSDHSAVFYQKNLERILEHQCRASLVV